MFDFTVIYSIKFYLRNNCTLCHFENMETYMTLSYGDLRGYEDNLSNRERDAIRNSVFMGIQTPHLCNTSAVL